MMYEWHTFSDNNPAAALCCFVKNRNSNANLTVFSFDTRGNSRCTAVNIGRLIVLCNSYIVALHYCHIVRLCLLETLLPVFTQKEGVCPKYLCFNKSLNWSDFLLNLFWPWGFHL